MMPHPNVAPSVEGIILQQKKTWYNEEAARGVTNWKYQDTNVNIFYGIGGCLALPAQNGWDVYHEVIFQEESRSLGCCGRSRPADSSMWFWF